MELYWFTLLIRLVFIQCHKIKYWFSNYTQRSASNDLLLGMRWLPTKSNILPLSIAHLSPQSASMLELMLIAAGRNITDALVRNTRDYRDAAILHVTAT